MTKPKSQQTGTPKPKPKAKAKPKPKVIEPKEEVKPSLESLVPETENIIILTDEAKAQDPHFQKYTHAVEPQPLSVEQIRTAARLAVHGRPKCQP